MAKAVSVRLSDTTRRTVARLARAHRRTQSEVIRDAIEAYLEKAQEPVRPFDAWKDVIGMIKGGPTDLSEHTGQKVRRLLEERRRRKS